jgi:hypothetical protein
VVEHSAAAGRAAQQKLREEQQQELEQYGDAGPRILQMLAAYHAQTPDPAAAWDPPRGLLQLLGDCLVWDPARRKTTRELLALPWFAPERSKMRETAQARGPTAAPSSPTAAGGGPGLASAAAATSWGPALDTLLEEWSGSRANST